MGPELSGPSKLAAFTTRLRLPQITKLSQVNMIPVKLPLERGLGRLGPPYCDESPRCKTASMGRGKVAGSLPWCKWPWIESSPSIDQAMHCTEPAPTLREHRRTRRKPFVTLITQGAAPLSEIVNCIAGDLASLRNKPTAIIGHKRAVTRFEKSPCHAARSTPNHCGSTWLYST